MSNRWGQHTPERKIEAFIGAWGVKTGDIQNTEHLLELASRLFEVENTGISDAMASVIDALGKKERKRLAQKNIETVMGSKGRFASDWGESSQAGGLSQAALHKMMDNSREHLVNGDPFDCEGELDIDPAKLLRKVVSAVISSGCADILWEFPDVLAFFGSRIPDRSEVAHHFNVDERMFEAKAKWPNLKREC